jgi:hypothetical protein
MILSQTLRVWCIFPILENCSKKYIIRNVGEAIMTQTFNVIIEEGEDGYLISEVVELPGCHTQAKTHDELIERTREAISLYLSEE